MRFHAGDRTDTVVEVLPTDPERDADVRLAEQTQVSCAGGRPHIEAPRQRTLCGRPPSVDIVIELPAGSRVEAEAAWADFRAGGGTDRAPRPGCCPGAHPCCPHRARAAPNSSGARPACLA
ncbi:hypothetical protein AB0H94_29950 [Streptomyces purpurascens]|uniref:hypothetical protein n=1 Tax=Streptomyces purpurascens TaxID=1924 RepID=UPI0033C42F5B